MNPAEQSIAVLGHTITPYVDREWPPGTALDDLNEDARATVENPETEIYAYGYYRTDPPRLQWGFFNSATGIAVVYDVEADLVATVFKPEEGVLFFERQFGDIPPQSEGCSSRAREAVNK